MIGSIQIGSLPTQYAVGWFTLALINAGLAQGKGPRWLWFLTVPSVVGALVVGIRWDYRSS